MNRLFLFSLIPGRGSSSVCIHLEKNNIVSVNMLCALCTVRLFTISFRFLNYFVHLSLAAFA